MNEAIVSSLEPIGLVGGGASSDALIELAERIVTGWVAADGGADALLQAGRHPRAVIGDMDSLSDRARARFAAELHPIPEQESTDFDKALRSIRAPLVVGVGFTGGRVDHELAAFSTLLKRADCACILLGAQSLVFHCPPQLSLTLPKGDLVSLFPLQPLQVASTGLVWETEGLTLQPGVRVGTSNEVREDGPVRLAPSGDGLLVILRSSQLVEAARALGESHPQGQGNQA
ncbi:MAG: thiamine diphosphokinase [Rhodobacterales bacterium]|nr:MAG: thiamine diphosphokinase [Rhodobacterales bacterium]